MVQRLIDDESLDDVGDGVQSALAEDHVHQGLGTSYDLGNVALIGDQVIMK